MESSDINYLNMIFALAAVIGLILACAWFVRRISGGVTVNNRLIKVVSMVSLGTKEKLVLVNAGGTHLLLGVTGQQITPLKEFDQPLEDLSQSESSHFSDKLKTILKGSEQWQSMQEKSPYKPD